MNVVRPAPDLPEWTVRRSTRARRARITVTDDGRVVVVLPSRAPAGVAETLVRHHEPWVRRHVAMALARRSRLDARPPLLHGRVLEVNGVPHAVLHQPTLAARAEVRRSLDSDQHGLTATLEIRARDAAAATRVLETWLRAEARRLLTERVASVAPVMGVTPTTIAVRDQRSRWGSAARGGSLSFSWRLVLAPPYVLDTVVTHELAHLRHADHSPGFWALVRAHAPRTDEARRWLRANRDALRSALD
ncbi:MAG: SprT family zinc-dependent metalloprotease [Candidatus Limnocylindrales bacterium]